MGCVQSYYQLSINKNLNLSNTQYDEHHNDREELNDCGVNKGDELKSVKKLNKLAEIYNEYRDRDWDYGVLIVNDNVSIESIKNVYKYKQEYVKYAIVNRNFLLTSEN